MSTSIGRRRRRALSIADHHHHHLPVDVMEDIILKLPVKHVLRCKSLSKTYYALIKNPSFINRHLVYHKTTSTSTNNNIVTLVDHYNYSAAVNDRHNNNIVCLLPYPHSGVYFIPPLATKAYSMEIVGSCNGLLCANVYLLPYTGGHHRSDRTVFVWNPATREQLTLPSPPLHKKKYNSGHDVQGFGYDATSDDYKLVLIPNSGSTFGSVTMKLWSLKANTWREIKNRSFGFIHGRGVFVQGNLYWLVTKDPRRTSLASFNIVDDTFCTDIELPPEVTGDDGVKGGMSITDHMGSLAFSIRRHCYVNGDLVNFVVWVMDDHETNSSWTKKYSIGTFLRPVVFIGFNYGCKFLMRDLRGARFIKYFMFDPYSKEENYLSEDGKLLHEDVCGHPSWTFCESLVSLKLNDHDDDDR